MARNRVTSIGPFVWAGLALLVGLGTPPAARGDAPVLAIRLTSGQSAIYAIEEIQRISFEGGAALVVEWAGGAQSYPAASIQKIEFLWDFSSVEGPEDAAAVVKALHLFQNRPNPFSPETRIAFELPEAGTVELRIYSPEGRLVRTLVSGELPAGQQEARWDGLDDAGKRAATGVYFYSLAAPGIAESRRMIVLP